MKNNYQPNIVYHSSDIFDSTINRINSGNYGSSIIIPHVCNNINLFGAGFANAINNRFPSVKENFHNLGNKARLGYVQYISVQKNKPYNYELVIANMIAQNRTISQNNPRPLKYESLVKCMVDVRNFATDLKAKTESSVEIHCPKFGSGLAGGDWNFIAELISEIWSQFPVIVYTYKLTKQK